MTVNSCAKCCYSVIMDNLAFSNPGQTLALGLPPLDPRHCWAHTVPSSEQAGRGDGGCVASSWLW